MSTVMMIIIIGVFVLVALMAFVVVLPVVHEWRGQSARVGADGRKESNESNESNQRDNNSSGGAKVYALRQKNRQKSQQRLERERDNNALPEQAFVYHKHQLATYYQRLLTRRTTEQARNSEEPPVALTKNQRKNRFSMVLLASLVLTPIMVFSAYFVIAYNSEIAAWHTLQNKVKLAGQRIAAGKELTKSEQAELADVTALDMARVMQANLKRTPDQADGWSALGSLYEQSQALDLARKAYKQSAELAPDRQDLALNYARIQMSMGDYAQASAVLDGVLASTPQHQSALLMQGFAHFYQEDYQTAIDYWQALIATHQTQNAQQSGSMTGQKSLALIAEQIAKAEVLMEEKVNAPHISIRIDVAAKGSATQDSSTPDPATKGVLFVVAKQVNTQGAQGAKGSQGMQRQPPLAIKRIVLNAATQYPIQLELSDSDAMLANNRLSTAAGKVSVQAFISLAGNVADKSGGQSAVQIIDDMKTVNKPVNLTINR